MMNIPKLLSKKQALLDAVESGHFESVLTESRDRELESIASHTFKKDKRVNIFIILILSMRSIMKNLSLALLSLMLCSCTYYVVEVQDKSNDNYYDEEKLRKADYLKEVTIVEAIATDIKTVNKVITHVKGVVEESKTPKAPLDHQGRDSDLCQPPQFKVCSEIRGCYCSK